MKTALIGIALLGLLSCSPSQTKVVAPTTLGNVTVQHDANIASPPTVDTKSDDVVINAPAGTKVTVAEFSPLVGANSVPVEIKRTTMEFPSDKGGEIKIKQQEMRVAGSAGHEPPPPATPLERSLGAWSYAGVFMFLLGVFFCTPWGGGNMRVGMLIGAGGLTMSLLGLFLNELSQWMKVKMPSWLPAVGLLGIGAALFLWWGYKHRLSETNKNETNKSD